jgi:hypothetical protein
MATLTFKLTAIPLRHYKNGKSLIVTPRYSGYFIFLDELLVTIVRTVFSSYPETLDFPLLARLPWSLETIILRLVIKNCPNYCWLSI